MSDEIVNPWRKISERLVYQNPWVSLVEDEVINPDGTKGVYAVYNIRYAIGVVVVDDDGDLYLVGQYRYGTGEFAWEIVEGGVENGESPFEAAKRELREELGFVADEWSQLGPEIHISNCHTNEKGSVFLARKLSFVGESPEGSEVLKKQKVSVSGVKKMIERGDIRDALSLIALHRYLANP